MTEFDVGQIDAVHRRSTPEPASTIIPFIKKSDQTNFYYQKKKFYPLDAKSPVEEHYHDNESGRGKTFGRPIYLNESIIPQNRLLLR